MKKKNKLNVAELKIAVFENNQADKRNKDRLFKLAKANDDIETIEKLRDEFGFKGAKVYLDKLANRSLDDAIKNRDIKLLEKLIDRGVDVSSINIAELAKKNYKIDFLKTLIDNGSNINARAETSRGELGFTALHIASEKRNNIELVKLLISKGANVNILNQLSATALITASYWGNLEIVKILCKKNAKLDIQDAEGATALLIAVQHKNMEIVDTLLTYGANINIPLKTGSSPLMIAVVNNDYLMVEKILQNFGDINLRFSDKKYPYYNYRALDIAYEERNIKYSEFINEGKIYTYKDENGKEKVKGQPSIIGHLMQYDDIIELLENSYLTSSVFIDECFEKVNLTITTPYIAKRFILEELDSATMGNEEAQKWAKESGYNEYEYLGKLSKSFPQVDGAEGPQQTLTRLIPYGSGIHNEKRHDLNASVRRKVVDKIMKYYSLGKYKEKIKRIQLCNFEIIDIYNTHLIFSNNRYEPLSENKYINPILQTYIEIKNEVVIFSYVDYDNEKEEDVFEIMNTQELYLFDIKQEKKHIPKQLIKILNLFTKENPIKYTSHSFEWSKYGSYQNFIDEVKKEFSQIDNKLNILSSNLHSKIINFLFNESLNNEKAWGKHKIAFGWSSLLLKEWCEIEEKKNNAKKAIYFPLPKVYQYEINGRTLTTFDDICTVFKEEIEIRDNDKLKSIFEKIEEEVLGFDFEVEYINIENITFYTDVEYFENAVTKIFEQFKERAEHDSIFIEADNQESYVDIIIEQRGSTVNKSSEEMKKEIDDGDFQDIRQYLFSLCDWSIEVESDLHGNFRVEYLSENQAVQVTEPKEEPKGFRHILRFYK